MILSKDFSKVLAISLQLLLKIRITEGQNRLNSLEEQPNQTLDSSFMPTPCILMSMTLLEMIDIRRLVNSG